MEYWSNGKTKTWNLVGISESFKRLALNMHYAACVHRLNVRIVIQCKARFGQSSLDEPQYSNTPLGNMSRHSQMTLIPLSEPEAQRAGFSKIK